VDSSDSINLLTRAISADKSSDKTTETADKTASKKFKDIPPPFGKEAVAPKGELEESEKAYKSIVKQIESSASKPSNEPSSMPAQN